MADDRELTGDEAQRALSEAMRRTRATVPDPSPAELIAFVREQRDTGWADDHPMWDAVLRLLSSSPSSVATGAGAPHHCAPSDYMAMIVRLQFIESGEYSPKDFDWRTQAGVLWRMLEYATRPTDASVDAFLAEYAAKSAPVPLPDAARVERLLELLERAKLYVESVEVQPSFGDGSRHLESDSAKDLRIAIDDEVAR